MYLRNVTLDIIALMFFTTILAMAFPELNYVLAMSRSSWYEPWRWVTSLFLHFGFAHLFFNTFALLMFGLLVEHRIGLKRYLILFFGSGFLGNVGFLLFSSGGIGAGASGAIFGILGVATVLFPDMVVFMNFIPMPMRVAGPLMAVLEFLLMLGLPDGIGHSAHLFGFVFGYLYAKKLRRPVYTYMI